MVDGTGIDSACADPEATGEPMIVYVAGASAEWERAQRVMEWVRSEGWTVAHDWVADVIRERIEGGRSDAELTLMEQARYARGDLKAIEGVDYLWFLAPEKPTAGAWVELGFAYAQEAVGIIVSGAENGNLMWCSLADQRFETDSDAFEALLKQAEE